MSSATFLDHVDPKVEVKLCCGATPYYGVGSILSAM